MDNDTKEPFGDEMTIERINAQIFQNIRCSNTPGTPSNHENQTVASDAIHFMELSDDSFQRDLSLLNTMWDIHNTSYFITSHRPYIGYILIQCRNLIHGEVCRYIDPVISRQTEFNACSTRIINIVVQNCIETDRRIRHHDDTLRRWMTQYEKEIAEKISLQGLELIQKISQTDDELTRKIGLCEAELIQKISLKEEINNKKIRESIASCVLDEFSRLEKRRIFQTGNVQTLEKRMQENFTQNDPYLIPDALADTNYLHFEEKFRGSRDVIKQRQTKFLHYFKNSTLVLDIGCGRGEFLEILKENRIGGVGIDIDTDMVEFCRSRELNVIQADAISYLENLDDNYLDGIFLDQVVEHLDPAYLLRLLSLCYRKMKAGSTIVIETVNPLSFISFVNFYIDLTHTRPVHPETLEYLLNAAGFRICEKIFSSPVPDDERLKKVETDLQVDDTARRNAELYNQNIDRLNSLLFGAQDYAIICTK
ncbi:MULTISPECIES: methionine biosynthesis protein MetW [unclassified Methanoregula]|uniref:methionine biosynthesis protein MetW n=1 Tax=unclassified Methanoregula TaxID=2649730 RepID=UPI0009D0C972|nr:MULTISPECIES: methionine biosynthesis protein MetW [unclassified Methanoregula]OPX65140.1 MAG: hypothetical protein A4E33_00171 [Methanoregula sp. PtaB.Bin085]OPY32052.1 MAG: hypothetical protein A4E34_02424 [Methanoregula sp. PtaU1.Bin006]